MPGASSCVRVTTVDRCPSVSQNAAGPAWDKLRFCESGGNYAIADSSGMFRGAYQFAISTWYGIGGVGDPADAPPSEQDYRAQILYDALGAKPWPVCGRFLIEDPPPRSDGLPGLVENLPPDQPLTGPGITTPSTTTTSTSTTDVDVDHHDDRRRPGSALSVRE